MRVLLTGGAGYVGSATLRHLSAAGHDVAAYDDLSTGHPAALDGARLIRGDVGDTARLARAMDGADAVMHFAASTRIEESFRDPALYWRNNVIGTQSVLDAMEEAGVTRLLFSSTCAVYGEAAANPVAENAALAPRSGYARTKAAAEGMISDVARARGLDVAILRYFNAAGASDTGAFGDPRAAALLLPLAIDAALGLCPHIEVFGTDYPTPDGSCIRDYVHVDDLAEAHRLALEKQPRGVSVFNLGTGQGHSVFEVIDAVRRVTGRDVPTRLAPRRDGDASALVADPSKIAGVLGWRPSHRAIDDIVRTAWVWRRDHAGRYGARPIKAP